MTELKKSTEDAEAAKPAESEKEAAAGPEAGAARPGEKKSSRKNKLLLLVVLLLALLLAGFGGYALWKSNQPQAPASDPGATIRRYDDSMSDDEIRDELNRQADESRMTISVSPQPKLDGSRVRVNVENVDDNKFAQTFTLSQDGKVIYSSGLVKPGEVVEWVDADSPHEGDATMTIQACDPDSGAPSGNPQSVAVKIVAAGSTSADN